MANTKTSTKAKVSTESEAVAITVESHTPVIPKEIDPSQYVTVRNGFQGRLVYRSSRTGETFIWDGFGSEQEMELRELKNAKNAHKNFFINNWFMFDEDWIIEYLGVKQFYRNAIDISDFNDIFKKTPTELRKVVSGLSEGQKRSVAYRAARLIESGEIDSRKTIATLEEVLGIDLVEK